MRMREIAIGIIIGLVLYFLYLELKNMKSDITWCRVYVDQHLNKEQQESLKK